jgi:hypothetical protein
MPVCLSVVGSPARRSDYPNPCFTSTSIGNYETHPDMWVIPTSNKDLVTGPTYTITVTVSKVVATGTPELVASASVDFTLVPPDEVPRGTLKRPCTPSMCELPHNTAQDMVLVLAME